MTQMNLFSEVERRTSNYIYYVALKDLPLADQDIWERTGETVLDGSIKKGTFFAMNSPFPVYHQYYDKVQRIVFPENGIIPVHSIMEKQSD